MEQYQSLSLTMESEAMITLRMAIDRLLTQTIARMRNTHHDKAKLAVTMEIELIDAAIPDGAGGMREGIVPKIEHNVKSQIQLTNEIKGMVPSGFEMVWDRENKCYLLRPIPKNQTSLFDDERTTSGLLEDDEIDMDLDEETPLPFEDDETA